jgi:hypothetical protein
MTGVAHASRGDDTLPVTSVGPSFPRQLLPRLEGGCGLTEIETVVAVVGRGERERERSCRDVEVGVFGVESGEGEIVEEAEIARVAGGGDEG